MSKVLEIKNLQVTLKTQSKSVFAVRGLSFDIEQGETLEIVGESGCGKSMTGKAIMQLLHFNAEVDPASEILFQHKNLLDKTDVEMEKIRGKHIGMIFQDPMSSLNPTMKIG